MAVSAGLGGLCGFEAAADPQRHLRHRPSANGAVGRAAWRGCAHSPTQPPAQPPPTLLPIYCVFLFVLNIKKPMLQKEGLKMAYFIPRLATAPNYSEGTSNYCLRRQKEGKNRSKKTPTMEWFHSNRFAPGFISYHGWLRLHRAHIFPIRAAMPPQALLPSLATAACVAQPTSGTPLCRPPPPPALIWDPVLVLCPGNPQHGLRGGGGRVGHPKAQLTPSAHSFTPLPPGEPEAQNTKRGQNQSRGHRERAEHSRDRPAAVWGQRRHRQWAASQRSAEDCQAGVGAGKGTVCGCAHLWGGVGTTGGGDLRGRGEKRSSFGHHCVAVEVPSLGSLMGRPRPAGLRGEGGSPLLQAEAAAQRGDLWAQRAEEQ